MLLTTFWPQVYKQWGNSWVTHDKGWVNFPIKFNKICFTCIPIYTDYGDSPTYTSAVALSKKDVTGFNFRTAANKITLSYIAIGMQLQWGTIYNAKAGALDNNNNNNAVTFPMPFTTVFALSPTFIIKANHVNVDVIVNLYSLSNTGAVIRCWDYDNATNDGQLIYVALGKQQWGYAQKPTSEYDFDWVYPIPFPTLVGAIMLTPQYEGQCRPHSINSFDRFSCSLRTDGTKPKLNSNHVFAIGFQQWGNAGNSGGSVNATFPVSFTKTVYQIQLTYNNDSYENPTYEIKDTKSFRYWSKYGGNKLWLAIGAQQWGVGDKYANKYSIETLPIAFSNVDYALMITNRNLSAGMYISGAALSTTQIKVWNGGYSDRYYFFAIGW